MNRPSTFSSDLTNVLPILSVGSHISGTRITSCGVQKLKSPRVVACLLLWVSGEFRRQAEHNNVRGAIYADICDALVVMRICALQLENAVGILVTRSILPTRRLSPLDQQRAFVHTAQSVLHDPAVALSVVHFLLPRLKNKSSQRGFVGIDILFARHSEPY